MLRCRKSDCRNSCHCSVSCSGDFHYDC